MQVLICTANSLMLISITAHSLNYIILPIITHQETDTVIIF